MGKGGNFLLNVGPQPDGELPAEAVRRLEEIGAWMKVNGEAIHGTRPIAPYKEGQTVFTRKGRDVYAIVLLEGRGRPLARVRRSSCASSRPGSPVHLLGWHAPLPWTTDSTGSALVPIPAEASRSASYRHGIVLRFTPEQSH